MWKILLITFLFSFSGYALEGIDPETESLLPYGQEVEMNENIYSIVINNMKAASENQKKIDQLIESYKNSKKILVIRKQNKDKDEYSFSNKPNISPLRMGFDLSEIRPSDQDATFVSSQIDFSSRPLADVVIQEQVKAGYDASSELLLGCFKGFDEELIEPLVELTKIAAKNLSEAAVKLSKRTSDDAGNLWSALGDLISNRYSTASNPFGTDVTPASDIIFSDAFERAAKELETRKEWMNKKPELSVEDIKKNDQGARDKEKWQKSFNEALAQFNMGTSKNLDVTKQPFVQASINAIDPEMLYEVLLASLATKEPGMDDKKAAIAACGGIAFLGTLAFPALKAPKLAKFALWLEKVAPVLNKSERFLKYINGVKRLKVEEIAAKFSLSEEEAKKVFAIIRSEKTYKLAKSPKAFIEEYSSETSRALFTAVKDGTVSYKKLEVFYDDLFDLMSKMNESERFKLLHSFPNEVRNITNHLRYDEALDRANQINLNLNKLEPKIVLEDFAITNNEYGINTHLLFDELNRLKYQPGGWGIDPIKKDKLLQSVLLNDLRNKTTSSALFSDFITKTATPEEILSALKSLAEAGGFMHLDDQLLINGINKYLLSNKNFKLTNKSIEGLVVQLGSNSPLLRNKVYKQILNQAHEINDVFNLLENMDPVDLWKLAEKGDAIYSTSTRRSFLKSKFHDKYQGSRPLAGITGNDFASEFFHTVESKLLEVSKLQELPNSWWAIWEK